MSKMRGLLSPLCLGIAAVLALVVVVSTSPSRPAAVKATPAAATGSWTVYHHDDGHTGFDPTLPKVAGAAAGWTSPTLDGQVYAEPLIFSGVVYAATLNGTVYALNQSTGVPFWSKNVGAVQTSGWGCSTLMPGILSTPVIDTAANRIYVVAEIAGTTPTYHLFGLDLANSGNIVLNTAITPPGFDWTIQGQRGALGLRNGFVYVPFGGRDGDCGTYHGYIAAVPTSGAAITNYYATPGSAAGFWGAGGVVIDDSTGNVFETSGNGTGSGCSANLDGTPTYENDAVVRFSSTLVRQDSFVPQDWQNNWCANDQDLGSATAVLISPSLMFQSGKWGTGFLLNPASLGGMDGQLFPTPKPATYSEAPVCFGNNSDATFGSFAYAAPFVYVECQGHGVVALSTNTSTPAFSPCAASCASPDWSAGGTATFGPPIVAGGAVWVVDIGTGGLYGFDAATGAQIYHSASFSSPNHFVTPAEAGGSVYVPADNVIKSFDLNFGCMGTPLSTSYFNWYDKASPGMLNDNIHIINTGASTSSGCVTVSGYPGVSWVAAAGQETYVTLPPATIGGPVLVTVNSGPPVLASQRVQYYQSFNEVWASTAAQAATTSYFNWYDKASPGMSNDNIHLLNPGGTSATVAVSLPGSIPQMATVPGGAELYVSFPAGTIGGPVTVSSTQPILASQRVQYYQSFNEVLAQPASTAATTSYVNWFDKSTPGMLNDNIHLLNPGGTSATVTVGVPGATSQIATVAAGAEAFVTFPHGTIGGPVTVTSTQPVLAAQRVQFYQTFNEVWAESASQAATTSHLNWFDKASPGMYNDNIHLLNPGGTSATVTVSLPGATNQVVTVGAGAEAFVTFPAGKIGGPVIVSSTQAVLASQRVQYYSSFNEIWAG
jgi:outer membrane protein assembly factor BamB